MGLPIKWQVIRVIADQHMVDRGFGPARYIRRFYRLSIQRDLFVHASLVRQWGRIGFRGQMMVETHPDEGKRRGYAD